MQEQMNRTQQFAIGRQIHAVEESMMEVNGHFAEGGLHAWPFKEAVRALIERAELLQKLSDD